MTEQGTDIEKRNQVVLFGHATFSSIAWTMANASVVLSYLAISLDLPVFLVGLFVTFTQSASLLTAFFGTPIAAKRTMKKTDVSATYFVIAVCFLAALTAAAFGTSIVIAIVFVGVVFVIGAAGEYQAILKSGLYGDVLNSDSRTRLMYNVMAIGGLSAGALSWTSHHVFSDDEPFTRHAILLLIATFSFVLASAMVLLVHEFSTPQSAPDTHKSNKVVKLDIRHRIQEAFQNFKFLFALEWFRRYLRVRLSLLTVEMSVPFYAILAALVHHDTPRGLSALIISSATGMLVAGPLWRIVGIVSIRSVMICGGFLAAFAGFMLVINTLHPIFHAPYVHAAALFIVTIAVMGVSTARSLYFIDVAPAQYRLIALGTSKIIVRIVGIGLSFILAAVAHLQHVVWAILALALINAFSAVFAFRTADEQEQPSDKSVAD